MNTEMEQLVQEQNNVQKKRLLQQRMDEISQIGMTIFALVFFMIMLRYI